MTRNLAAGSSSTSCHWNLSPQATYDVMDMDAPQYAADHAALRATILQLEHRLGALIIQVGARNQKVPQAIRRLL